MEWFHCWIPLHPPGGLDLKDFHAIEDMFFIQTEDEFFSEDWLQCYATEILDTKYDWTEVTDVIDKLNHLNARQKADLLWVLQDNSKCFVELLAFIHTKKVHINLIPSAKAVHL